MEDCLGDGSSFSAHLETIPDVKKRQVWVHTETYASGQVRLVLECAHDSRKEIDRERICVVVSLT
jgi:hypothetical protein